MNQITSHILMVRPAHFGYNEETAASNAFQQPNAAGVSPAQIAAGAIEEFDQMVLLLRGAGVDVIVEQDSDQPLKTDAVFPNNWVTFHENGAIVTYPMLSPNRRLERREEIIQSITSRFHMKNRYRLEDAELDGIFLEGTGSLILDRPNRLAYACISPRTDRELLRQFGLALGFTPVPFDAVDPNGQAIYHTNVMMALGTSFVVICLDSVTDPGERRLLLRHFEATGKEVIEISFAQMMAFAGNMLQVKGQSPRGLLVMSQQAFRSLRPEQISRLEAHTDLLPVPLYTIEQYGGGSARCMMAEVFLPEQG